MRQTGRLPHREPVSRRTPCACEIPAPPTLLDANSDWSGGTKLRVDSNHHQQYLARNPNGYCLIHAAGVALPED